MMCERELIVAWLRDPKRREFIPMPDRVIPAHMETDDYGEPLFWRKEERRKISRLPTALDFADAIERGEHLQSRRHTD